MRQRRFLRLVLCGGALLPAATGCGKVAENGRDFADPAPPLGGAGGLGASGGAPSVAGSPLAGGMGTVGGASPAKHRLVPWQLEAPGTEPLVLGIFDTTEQLHCRFLPDAEGSWRCLPEQVLEPATDYDSHGVLTQLFTDSTCQELVYVDKAEFQPKLRHTFKVLGASCAASHYVAGTYVSAGSVFYGGSSCERLVSSGSGLGTLVTLDAAEPTERWEAGTPTDGAHIAGRIRMRQVVTTDGARFNHELVDERWDEPCTVGEVYHLTEHWTACVPPYSSSPTRFFTDPSCRAPVWLVPPCAQPTFILKGLGVADREYQSLGEPWTGPVFGRDGHGGCHDHAEAALEPPERFFQPGATLEPEAVSEVTWQLASGGRLQLRGLRDDDGQFVALDDRMMYPSSERFYDTVESSYCTPARFADAIRCGNVELIETGVP